MKRELFRDALVLQYSQSAYVAIDNVRMIVHRKVSWIIGMMAIIIIILSDSIASTVKSVKLRRKLMIKSEIPYKSAVVGPLIVKVIHNNSDVVHNVSFNNTPFIHRVTRNYFNLSNYENHDNTLYQDENDSLSKERSHVVYPKKYENFVSKKYSTRRVNKNSILSNTSDNNTTKVTTNLSKNVQREIIDKSIKIKNISEYMERRNLSKRNINKSVTNCGFCDQDDNEHKINRTRKIYEYLPRRNSSDYYTKRRAVMEKYYARQREINARYANRTNDSFRLRTNGNELQGQSTVSNASLFGLGYSNTISHYYYPSSITINPLYNNGSAKVNNSRDIISGTKFDYKYDIGLSQDKNGSNVVRNVPNYYVTPTSCTNVSLSGTLVPKTRWKQRKNDTDNATTSITDNVNHGSTIKPANNTDSKHWGNQSWGQCTGKIVYQHNLLLGLRGPSNLNAVFEVIIQGPVCITCVQALRYNETRAMVSLDSGGRGHEYAKLKLMGFENEGFSYIIKVWAVRKRGQDCNDINN